MTPRSMAPSVLGARDGAGSPAGKRGQDGASSSPAQAVHDGVRDIQRARMIAAMVELAAELGVGKLSVSAVVTRSGVSRRTFYEVFTDVRECLMATLEDSLEHARSYVRAVDEPSATWRERTRVTLHALLCFAEDEPAHARLLVVEAPGAGVEALERRAQVLGELIDAVDAGRTGAGRNAALTSLTAEGLVGSVLAVVHARLVGSSNPGLAELTNPLMSMIALPYLGAAVARKELERPLPKRRCPPTQSFEGASRLNDLPMRITYRTMRVLNVIAAQPGASNRQIGVAAGMVDQGQVSKLLQRLDRLELIMNRWAGQERGMANQWQLTPTGEEIVRATRNSGKAGP